MRLDREYLRAAYKKLFYELWKVTTIHGLSVLRFRTACHHGRKLWLLFLIALIIWTHYVIIQLTLEYLDQPTEIHMSPTLVHVSKSPFPSVAICSANKFSKRKVFAFAKKVFQAQQQLHPHLLASTVPEMAEHLLLLAGLYVYPYDNYDIGDKRLEKMHNILARLYGRDEYPTRDILRELAPDCEDLVVRAKIFGDDVNTTDVIIARMTSTSVCCMFNYVRRSYANNKRIRDEDNAFLVEQKNVTFESNTVLNNVAFVLRADPDDFMYKDLSTDAFRLYITSPNEYVTVESNKMGEILVNHDAIVEIPIQPSFFDASRSIKEFPPSVRKCYFAEEGEKLLNTSYYSLDECLLVCRMRSMLSQCGCVNPSLPADMIGARFCSLMDLPCLTQWKAVWYLWHELDIVAEGQKRSTTAYRNCEYCLPTCDGVSYDIYVNDLPLRRTVGAEYSYGILKGLSNAQPLAIIKVFFQQAFAQTNEDVIVSDWVVLLNRFGGIMSLMYGFGLMSVIELLYFGTGKYLNYFTRSFKRKFKRSNELLTPPDYNLYWQELNPNARAKRNAIAMRGQLAV